MEPAKILAARAAVAGHGLSFRKAVEAAYDASGGRVPLSTLHHHWHRYARLARALASRLAGPGDVPVVGSTGLPGCEAHLAYDVDGDRLVAVVVTGPTASDARGLGALLDELPGGPGVLLGDAAYFGWNLFWRAARRGYLLVARPRRPSGRRRSRARRLEELFYWFRRLYRRRAEGERGAALLKRYLGRPRQGLRDPAAFYSAAVAWPMLYLAL